MREADKVCGSEKSITFTMLLSLSAKTSFSSCVQTMEVMKGFSMSSVDAGVATNTLRVVAVIRLVRGVWVLGRMEEDMLVAGRWDELADAFLLELLLDEGEVVVELLVVVVMRSGVPNGDAGSVG